MYGNYLLFLIFKVINVRTIYGTVTVQLASPRFIIRPKSSIIYNNKYIIISTHTCYHVVHFDEYALFMHIYGWSLPVYYSCGL